jgi:hypothetical protein
MSTDNHQEIRNQNFAERARQVFNFVQKGLCRFVGAREDALPGDAKHYSSLEGSCHGGATHSSGHVHHSHHGHHYGAMHSSEHSHPGGATHSSLEGTHHGGATYSEKCKELEELLTELNSRQKNKVPSAEKKNQTPSAGHKVHERRQDPTVIPSRINGTLIKWHLPEDVSVTPRDRYGRPVKCDLPDGATVLPSEIKGMPVRWTVDEPEKSQRTYEDFQAEVRDGLHPNIFDPTDPEYAGKITARLMQAADAQLNRPITPGYFAIIAARGKTNSTLESLGLK